MRPKAEQKAPGPMLHGTGRHTIVPCKCGETRDDADFTLERKGYWLEYVCVHCGKRRPAQ